MLVDARLETKDLLPPAKGFNLSSVLVHIKSHEHATEWSIFHILKNIYIFIFLHIYISTCQQRVCLTFHLENHIGGVTPKGGFPKGICYKGLPAYFSVFHFCWWNPIVYAMISFALMTFWNHLSPVFSASFVRCNVETPDQKGTKQHVFFFTDPRRTRGLSSATTYYWYKASGWSHLLVARMDGGSGASRVFLKAQTHHCSMDFTVFKFFVFGIPFASMLSWCFMALNPVSLIESRHGCSIVMLNIIWSYRQ